MPSLAVRGAGHPPQNGERVTMTLEVDAGLMNVVVDRFGRDVDAVPSDDGRTATVTVPVVTPCLSGFSRHMEDGVAGKGHRLAAGYAHDELGVVIVGKEAACIIARCI